MDKFIIPRLLPASLLLACICTGCASTAAPRNVIVWISVDGNRFDYVDRAKPPFLTRLMREGAYTRQLTPAFPSLTFSSHTTEATGVYVDSHGIPGNAFYDSSTKTLSSYPDESTLMLAEPIWTTAQRQGLRCAVSTWPMSAFQTGTNAAAYSGKAFEKDATDAQLGQKLIDIWQSDPDADHPLRLLMGYLHKVDVVGHSKGPDSPEVLDALREDDVVLDHLLAESIRIFNQRMKPNDELYFIVTTDHGMSSVKTQFNLQRILGKDGLAGVHTASSGPVANIFLDDVTADEKSTRQDAILKELSAEPAIEVYTRDQLPPQWHFNHPTRVGDIVAVLKPGYSWEGVRTSKSQPAPKGGPRGMHGYPPEEDPDMLGFAVIWRYHHKLGGNDLGKVDTVQLEPTVAKILGIKPATGATAKPLNLP